MYEQVATQKGFTHDHAQAETSPPSQRSQRFWGIILLVLITTVLTAAPVQAETRIYLPYISQEAAPPTIELFTVEWVRLWSGRSSAAVPLVGAWS
jgi:hypothetical protein